MKQPIRVLELRSVRGTGGGPEKTILLGAARSDSTRFAVTVCYIRDERDPLFSIDDKAAGLDVDYVELRERHSFDPSIWGALRTLVRTRRIDIVHAHEYKTDFLASLLARFTGVSALATVHGWTGHTLRERWFYYPTDKFLLARFPRLIAVSSDIRNELVRAGASPNRISTIVNGIDHRVFQRDRGREQQIRQKLGIATSDLMIGTVGRLEPQKRFDLLIAATALIRAKYPTVRLLIVGEGSLRTALDDQIASLGLTSTCTLLGQRSDIVDLHHGFDLFVQSSDYEGTPNAVLEAMALETPVVATAAGGTSDILRPDIDGLLVERGSAAVLAEAIDRAFTNRQGAVMRASSARRRVETELSFDARMTAVEAIYTELFEQRPNPERSPAMAAGA